MIPIKVDDGYSENYSVAGFYIHSTNYTNTMAVFVDSTSWSSANTGVYNSFLPWHAFFYSNDNVVIQEITGGIPLTLKIGYEISVSGDAYGTASASCAMARAGETVTLTAVPNDGYRVKEWQVVSDNVTIENNQFTMPEEDVEIQAVFGPIYEITFDANGGTGTMEPDFAFVTDNTTYFLPECGYTAPTGKAFKEWAVEYPNGASTLLPANSKVQHITGPLILHAQWGESGVQTAVSPAGAGTAVYDMTTGKLTATGNYGYRFLGWQYADQFGIGLMDYFSTEKETTLENPADGTYTACFLHKIFYVHLTVNDETMGSASGDGGYYVGDPVTLTATANPGYRFVGWRETKTGNVWENDQFNMPMEHLYITAVFAPEYAVTVTNGTADMENAIEGEAVTITANAPESGKQFKEWTASGITLTDEQKSSANLTFTMPAQAVTLTATYEDMRYYAITSDGTAVATRFDGWLGEEVATDAPADEVLSLRLTDDAEPEEGYYFNGEFWYRATGANDNVYLGSVTENGWTSPVTEFTMPAYDVTIGAVQAARETLTLDFTQSASASLPLDAWMQLQMFESENPLILHDNASGIETLDVNLDGTGELLIAQPDYETTFSITLTLLPETDATGGFTFAFTGPSDRYGTITFTLPSAASPVFGTADFVLPAYINAIEANAFEGVAATVVDIPSGCTAIGNYAFKYCPNLTQIRIPVSVTTIGTDIFNGCAHTVYVFGTANSEAETYCQDHTNCVFVAE